jgi:hypothetical protein
MLTGTPWLREKVQGLFWIDEKPVFDMGVRGVPERGSSDEE